MGFTLIICLLFILLVSIPAGVIYVIYLPLKFWLLKTNKMKRSTSRVINKGYVSLVLVTIFYITYTGLYPGESFYAEEFKTITKQQLPASAEFVETNASYPDFHGEYCSSSQIKLSPKDYSLLLKSLSVDVTISKNAELIYFEEFDKIFYDKSTDDIIYGFQRKGINDDDYNYIGFYKDRQTIFVNLCKT